MMKILFIILLLSVGATLVTLAAMWLRLRWHLRRSDHALKNALADIQQEHEPMDKT
ncbi:MAG TPA: hypothetical protein VKW06_14840 [Candidatus Angelobacter sp.]|nr:hypothetical protein [Candidatus Angelobacter sp.]